MIDRNGLREFLLRLAPEIGTLTLVFTSDLDNAIQAAHNEAGVQAFTFAKLSEHGPAIGFNDEMLIKSASRFARGAISLQSAVNYVTAMAGVHELAHILQRDEPFFGQSELPPAPDGEIAYGRQWMNCVEASQHRLPWLRLVALLADRSQQCFNYSDLVFGYVSSRAVAHLYNAAFSEQISDALGNLARLKAMPMSEHVTRVHLRDIEERRRILGKAPLLAELPLVTKRVLPMLATVPAQPMTAPVSLQAKEAAEHLLEVPTFARLNDWVGLWSIEPQAADALQHLLRGIRLAEHVAEAPPALRSISDTVHVDGKRIATVRLSGTLMKSQPSAGFGTSTIQARREVRAAAADPNIDGIALLLDSPGGSVAGTADLASDVRAAGQVKPVWAHAIDMMCSAAYWIGSQASRVTANTGTAMVGSVGTIQVVQDLSAMAEKEGVRTLVFATGPLKSTGVPGSKVSDEQIAYLQGLIDNTQKFFDAAIVAGRRMSPSQLASIRHGGVLLANDAIDAKLIDGIQSLDQFMSEFVASINPKRTIA